MPRKPIPQSSVEIYFQPTPDGLVLDRVILHCANACAEQDLKRFLQRFRDPELDREQRIVWNRDG